MINLLSGVKTREYKSFFLIIGAVLVAYFFFGPTGLYAGDPNPDPYLSVDPSHQGILLHSVYHRPNGWDYIPEGSRIPCNESSMWGDYHMRETALYITRIISGAPYYTFFNGLK